jgi:RNA polymerase sigma factor (sigma-70 family)
MKPTSDKWLFNSFQKSREKGWDTFLEQHSDLIMAVIQKYGHDHDEVMEIYTFVLERLKENDCKRITSYYDKKREYTLKSWIVVVVRNCLFDWYRKEKGRKRLLKYVESLPEIDQWTFKYVIQKRYSYSDAYELLKTNHGCNLSIEELISRAEEINDNLQTTTRWRLLKEWQSQLPQLPLDSFEDGTSKEKIKNPSEEKGYAPESDLIKNDLFNIIIDSLNTLTSEERIIVELHVFRNLTLKEIAKILKEKKVWKVGKIFNKALQTLKDSLRNKGIDPSDMDIF